MARKIVTHQKVLETWRMLPFLSNERMTCSLKSTIKVDYILFRRLGLVSVYFFIIIVKKNVIDCTAVFNLFLKDHVTLTGITAVEKLTLPSQ